MINIMDNYKSKGLKKGVIFSVLNPSAYGKLLVMGQVIRKNQNPGVRLALYC